MNYYQKPIHNASKSNQTSPTLVLLTQSFIGKSHEKRCLVSGTKKNKNCTQEMHCFIIPTLKRVR